jgi:predicted RNase H-like HicB family nuclease
LGYGVIFNVSVGDEMKIKVIIERGQNGYYVANCPVLKSCWSQGKTKDEALRNIQEAIKLYLETDTSDFIDDGNKEIYEIAI